MYTCSAIEIDGLQKTTGWSVAFSYFFVLLYKTKNVGDRPPYSICSCAIAAPSFQSEYITTALTVYERKPAGARDVRDRHTRWWGSQPSVRVGRSRYEARGRQRRTNGWKVHVYFAKRARLTNRTNPPSHKSTPSSAISVHSNRHLFSHPSQTNSSLSLCTYYYYYHYYIIFL